MSGGSMDYVAWRIKDAAQFIQKELGDLELQKRHGRLIEPSQRYKEKYTDIEFCQSPEALTNAVISRLKDALVCVRKAAIYAERIEWLTSDDDGYESFCLRLDNQLADCEKHEGVE